MTIINPSTAKKYVRENNINLRMRHTAQQAKLYLQHVNIYQPNNKSNRNIVMKS